MPLTAASSEDSDTSIPDSDHRLSPFGGLALLLRNGADAALLLLSARRCGAPREQHWNESLLLREDADELRKLDRQNRCR